MLHKEIISEAWEITGTYKKKLFKYGFFPSFFTAILGVIYVTYQVFAFRHSEFFGAGNEMDYIGLASQIWDWIKVHGGASALIVILSFFVFLIYVVSPVICEGALIHYVTQARQGKQLQGGLQTGFKKFFPLFELSALLAPFHFVTFITESSFLVRNFGPSALAFVGPILGIILFIGVIINFLFVFANQYIVLEDEDMISAMKKSSYLVLGNIRESFFLWTFLFLIVIRIFINIFLVLLVPLSFIFVFTLFAKINLYALGIGAGLLVGAGIIWLAAYLLAGFSIFTTALWTLAFIEFRKKEIQSQTSLE